MSSQKVVLEQVNWWCIDCILNEAVPSVYDSLWTQVPSSFTVAIILHKFPAMSSCGCIPSLLIKVSLDNWVIFIVVWETVATVNMYRKFCEVSTCRFWDMWADRHADRTGFSQFHFHFDPKNFPPVASNFDVTLWNWPRQCQDEQHAKYLGQRSSSSKTLSR